MGNQPASYRGLLLPIFISVLSMIGICLILLTSYLNKPNADTPQEPTTTPFKFLFLATETKFTTITASKTPTNPPRKPTFTKTATNTGTVQAPSPISTGETPTSTQTPPATQTAPVIVDRDSIFTVGKYDDTNPRFIYNGDWTKETLIPDAFEETIVYSTTIGSAVVFGFTGRQLQIGYLGETDLGILRISINGTEYTLDQSVGFEWSSPTLPNASYTVVLTHQAGDQVFFDYINIVGSP